MNCCPCDRKADILRSGDGYLCSANDCIHSKTKNRFHEKNGKPVLISEFNCDTVCRSDNVTSYVKRTAGGLKDGLLSILNSGSTTKTNCQIFCQKVKTRKKNPNVLVIGSGEKGFGTKILWEDQTINITGIDVYESKTVDIICDAHYLPFKNESFDGIWIQAVLEHVVEPQKVVAEIHRVLNSNGLVYSECPFMQQVHEGAYDFTRFTVLGHRYLFKNFSTIKYGGFAGPETVLAWSIKYLVWSIFENRRFAQIVGRFVSLALKPIQLLTSERCLFDASSCTYFMGEKKHVPQVTHKALVKLYKGLNQ